jgi:hypothetical protein
MFAHFRRGRFDGPKRNLPLVSGLWGTPGLDGAKPRPHTKPGPNTRNSGDRRHVRGITLACVWQHSQAFHSDGD